MLGGSNGDDEGVGTVHWSHVGASVEDSDQRGMTQNRRRRVQKGRSLRGFIRFQGHMDGREEWDPRKRTRFGLSVKDGDGRIFLPTSLAEQRRNGTGSCIRLRNEILLSFSCF